MNEAKTDIDDNPKLDTEKIWDRIAELMLGSVLENFRVGGRPEWVPLKNGLPSNLFDTGRLFGSISWDSGEDFAEVFSEGVPYAGVHEFGFPPKNIPQRRYMKFQPEDIDRIVEMLADEYVIQLTEPKRWR